MNIIFRHGAEALSQTQIARAEQKIQKLSRYLPEGTFETLVHVDLTKESGSNSSESLWRTTINLDTGAERLTATETGANAERSTERAIKELRVEIRRTKTKKQSMFRRGAGLIKRMREGF